MAPINPVARGPTNASQRYYNNQIAPALGNTPSKIKCIACDTVKPKTGYSNKKLLDLGMHMRQERSQKRSFDPEKDVRVTCINCTGGQKVEMKCAECELWKGQKSYNATQWKKDEDEAMCEKCMAVRNNTEPGGTSDGDQGTDDETSGSGSASSDGSDNDLSDRMHGAALRGAGTFSTSSGGTSRNTSANGTSIYASSTADSGRGTPSSTAPTSKGSDKFPKLPAVKRKTYRPVQEVNINDLQIDGDSASDSD